MFIPTLSKIKSVAQMKDKEMNCRDPQDGWPTHSMRHCLNVNYPSKCTVVSTCRNSLTLEKECQVSQNWLITLPVKINGFKLNKQKFTEVIALWSCWSMDGLPTQCSCGSSFYVDHAMKCKKGSLICIRQDGV